MSEELEKPIVIDPMKPCITKEDQEAADAAIANGEVISAKDIPTPEEQMEANKRNRAAVIEAFKEQWISRFDLVGIDLEKELDLIDKKQSKLSRSRRDAVKQFFMLFPVIKDAEAVETKKDEVSDVKPE